MSNDFPLLLGDTEKRAKSIIRKITHSGETDLNKEDLQELKELCKASKDDLMLDVFKVCFKYLHKDHSQIRVSTVKLIDYLFRKSHIIREKILDNFNVFLELTLAITQKPKVKLCLPPPKKFAALLQELTAKLIHQWHSDYSCGYEKLRYAHRFLKEHKLVDFSRFQVHTHEQLINQRKLAERQEKILTRTIENRINEYRDLRPDIEQILAQIESLLELILPTNSDSLLDVSVDSLADNASQADIRQQQKHGITNLSQQITIEFSPYVEVSKTSDNNEIVQNLKELKKQLVDSKLNKLIAIEKTISKRGEQFVNTLREIIDLKHRATNIVMKLGELKIINDDDPNKSKTLDANSDSDEDSDFEEVEPKEDLETYIPKSMRYEYGLEPIDPKELDTSNSKLTLTDEGFISDGQLAGTSSVSIGAQVVPTFTCNVRLESGKLCPRRDKLKCPFHGKIIARDEKGQPLDDKEREAEEARAARLNSVPDWQDPELLADIKAATGVDLTMPAKGKRKVSVQRNLANTKTCDLTPKQRLQKRLKMLNR